MIGDHFYRDVMAKRRLEAAKEAVEGLPAVRAREGLRHSLRAIIERQPHAPSVISVHNAAIHVQREVGARYYRYGEPSADIRLRYNGR